MSSRQLDEERILHLARELLDPAHRVEYLDQICAGDQALRNRVEALLHAHEHAEGFLRFSQPEPAPTVEGPPVAERVGATIGRYRLMEQIGEGGMGIVFVAEQERPIRRKVAIKVIKPGMDSRAVIARFEAERQALAMMDHSNIAKVFDAGTTDAGHPYFAMELVRGLPITDYCDGNRLAVRERLDLFMQVCQAIQHAHQKGIIHRDIKPSNVLVTLHDGKPVPKVIDFGVAKAINARLTDRTIYTEHLQVIGTLLYMSPEQAELSGMDIDTRSDIYSLGVLLYELLTGTTPFQKDDLDKAGFDEQRRIIREKDPPRASVRISSLGETATSVAKHRKTDPNRLRQLVRGDLDWIVMKALEKDRTRRYESASDLTEDLNRFVRHEPIGARPPSAAYKAKKWVRRNRTVAITSTLVMLALMTAAIGTTTGWHRARRETERAQATNVDLEKKNAELVATQKDLIGTLFDQGMLHALSGNVDATELAITRLEHLDATDLAETLKALRLMHTGELQQAVELLERATQRNPQSVAFWALLSNAYDGAGNLLASFQAFARLRTLTPKTPDECYFASRGYAPDPKTGLAYAERAARERASPVSLLARARMLADYAVQAGLPERAEEALHEIRALTWYYGTTGWLRIDILATYLLAASTQRAAGSANWSTILDEAQKVVQAIEQQPKTVVWEKLYLAMYYQMRGDKQRALTVYRRAAEDSGGDYATLLYLALACELDAVPRNMLAELDNRSLGLFSEIGHLRLLVIQGRFAEAVQRVSPLAATWKSADAAVVAVETLYLAGRPHEAQELAAQLARSPSAGPKRVWTEGLRDKMLQFYADPASANELLETAEQSDYPARSLTFAHWALAVECLSRSDLEQARSHFQQCADQGVIYLSYCPWANAMLAVLERKQHWPPTAAKQ